MPYVAEAFWMEMQMRVRKARLRRASMVAAEDALYPDPARTRAVDHWHLGSGRVCIGWI